jgi:hypothetical protein
MCASTVFLRVIMLEWLHSETTVYFMVNILFFYTQANVMFMCETKLN